ncbi:HU family DNA-binding protein [Spiroplasma alleghenense]|uniref:DNA-binding protein HU-beta n=1 Tax=Spiroplasma alleghenense TaxID=216931 RepID=A0A345Z488_9MOLU|nr:HU family DNA-binding protein [Spiroplasma alleghenense]AXK51417.1 DNA-binding protein HU-beta [Spiroplasma alleghenense]
MTKKELSEKMASTFDVQKSEADKMVSFVFDELTNALVAGDEVSIAGFGKFSVADRAAREGINPSSGEKIQIAATKVAKFKVAKQLKDSVAKS